MLEGQMLPGQMSPWQLESVLDVTRTPCLKFHQNRVSNSWDIANIEFLWWGVGGGGVVCKVIFMSNPTFGYVRLSWVVVELGFWQQHEILPNQTKPYQPNQAKPNQTRLRRVVVPVFILRSKVTLKNCVYLNSSILMLPGPKSRVCVEDPQLIWWRSTAYMCANPFSCQTQLKLG